MKYRHSILLAIILQFAAVGLASAAESAVPLSIRFALSNSPQGEYRPAPVLVVADRETARLQLPWGKTLIDYSFSPTIQGENVRLVIVSHCKDEGGHDIPSTLCAAYILPFDSEVRLQDGDHFLSVVVSRDRENRPQEPNQPAQPTPKGRRG